MKTVTTRSFPSAPLACLWVKAIQNPNLSITASTDFFGIGGDSISAMLLAALARDAGLMLSVAEIFLHPTLDEMALCLKSPPVDHDTPEANTPATRPGISPWTLLQIPFRYSERPGTVDDVFPCTPLQSALLSLSEQNPQLYLGQHPFVLGQATDIPRFKIAVERTIQECPILRTVFFPSEDSSNHMLQAIIKCEHIHWTEYYGPLDEFLAWDMQTPFRCGDLATRVALVSETTREQVLTHFVLDGHHAVYDGWSLAMQLKNVGEFYRQGEVSSIVPFKDFVQGMPPTAGEDAYWERELTSSTDKVRYRQAFPSRTFFKECPQRQERMLIGRGSWPVILVRTSRTCLFQIIGPSPSL
jgi:aryl carrier-like protein